MPENLLEFLQKSQAENQRELDECLRLILRALRTYLNLEIAFVSRFESSSQIMQVVDLAPSAAELPITKGSVWDIDATYCKRISDGKTPKFIHNAQEELSVADISATVELPIGTHISVPIRLSDGTVYGSICGFSRNVLDHVSERDVKFVELLGAFVSRNLQSAHSKSSEIHERRQEIDRIITERIFQPVYQSIVDITTGEKVGWELLTRFQDSRFKSPDLLFQEADNFGLKSDLEIAVIRDAIDRTHQVGWDRFVSINASPQAVATQKFKDIVAQASASQLLIELSEDEMVDSYLSLNAHLDKIRATGIRLAIDDIGSGYANFRHILELAPEVLKLDMNLIRNIDANPKKQALAASIVTYADKFDTRVIAEGVETNAELDVLWGLGITLVQGFYFSRPCSWTEATEL